MRWRGLNLSKIRENRLHLGSFDNVVEGWVNTDISPHITLAKIPLGADIAFRFGKLSQEQFRNHKNGLWKRVHRLDVSRKFPFDNNSFSSIYSSHVLEHLPRQVAQVFVEESVRVLSVSGVFRIAVPDLDAVVLSYDPSNPDATLEKIFELQERDRNRHWWMYNEISLARLLLKSGFTRVRRFGFLEGKMPGLTAIETRPGSLFMEAYKT